MRPIVRGTPAERFWAKVNKKGAEPPHMPGIGGCWLWTGRVNTSRYGYGMFQYGSSRGENRVDLAHRWVWVHENGPIPGRLCVLHHCDEPSCVRPSHLFLGTMQENTADMDRKGRARHWGHPRSDS